jgi:arabinofuranan 3-O-arabinosyltransferase
VSSTVSVTGAQPGKPFWLVLGQSQSNGWQATINGASLGTSRLIDGYANGWLVTPTNSSFTVKLNWTPQRTVWIGLAISAVAVLLCLGLALWPRRRRSAVAAARADDDVLALAGWRERVGHRRPMTSLAWVIVLGLASTLMGGPGAGIAVTVIAAGAFFLPYGSAVARVLPAGVLAVCVLYVLEVQLRYRLPADFNWVRNFDRIQPEVWLAPLLLILVLVLDRTRRLPDSASGSGQDMSESNEQQLQQPKTVEPTVGGTAGLPGQHAAPGTKRVSEDELADTVGGEGPPGGNTPADKETETGSNG